MDNLQPRLKELYKSEIIPKLKEELNKSNVMDLPKLTKITLNMGLGEAAADAKVIQSASSDLAAITGQIPVATKARKSIATFKIRDGMALGAKVTLRGDRMYEFADRSTSKIVPMSISSDTTMSVTKNRT